MKNKPLILISILILSLLLAACGGAATEAPAVEPTEAPVAAPTEAPVAEPTDAPTAEPTAAPTEAPAAAPDESPLPEPTAEPEPEPEPVEPAASDRPDARSGWPHHRGCDWQRLRAPQLRRSRHWRSHGLGIRRRRGNLPAL